MELLIALVALGIGSALFPAQITITVILLRSASGRIGAVGWVGGLTALRLLQGVVFGLIIGSARTTEPGRQEASLLVPTFQLVLAVAFYVLAARKALDGPDEDAPPPRWLARLEAVTPVRAFLLGAGVLAISVKAWVFTLGAIEAIGDARLGQPGSTVAFLLFVVLAQSIHLAAVGMAYAMPDRASSVLGRFSDVLTRYGRQIVIALGLVFGTWFLLQALSGFGMLTVP
jgi:hypothetical protein